MRPLLVTCAAVLILASVAHAYGPPGLDLRNLPSTTMVRSAHEALPVGGPSIAGNTNPGVLPPGSNPYGASYGEWGERWWRWVLSIPAGSNPLVNDASAFCDAEQSGPVWFLVGQNGTHSCTIPSGRGIFFPIINCYINAPCAFPECAANLTPAACAADPAACQACLQSGADDFLGSVTQLEVELDGHALADLSNYRASSGLFSFAADPSLGFVDGCLTVTPQPFLGDGFWMMLAPLSVGAHRLHFGGTGIFFGSPFTIDVTYDLVVAPHRHGSGSLAGEPGDTQTRTWGLVKRLFR